MSAWKLSLPRHGAMLFVAICVALLMLSPAQAGQRQRRAPDVIGQWDPPFDLGLVTVHATLLHTGKVLLYADPDTHVGSEAHIWNPADGSNVDISFNEARNAFCSGQTVLPDGRVLVAGGDRYGYFKTGTKLTTFFDPATEQWGSGPLMQKPRWYPTPLELGSGRTLVFAGQANKKLIQTSVESMNLAATAFQLLPPSADRFLGNYPSLHVMPGGQVFFSAEESSGKVTHPAVFNPQKNTWRPVGDMMDGPRYQAPSILLPGLHEVLVPGGTDSQNGNMGDAKSSAEIYDQGGMMPMWRKTAPMAYPRRNHNGVLLPDGTVLVVGGNQTGFYLDPVLPAELFDPVSETWSTMAAQQEPRGHHSVALLLPDGRVLSTGQTDGTAGNMGEIYSPPYMFKGPRPTVTNVASSIGFGQPMPILTPDAADISRVALVKPGSVTHTDNFDQRYVDLTYTKGSGVIDAISPVNGNLAPPGWYMLFVVNSAGVPSVASWVKVG